MFIKPIPVAEGLVGLWPIDLYDRGFQSHCGYRIFVCCLLCVVQVAGSATA